MVPLGYSLHQCPKAGRPWASNPGPDPQDPPGLFPVASLELGTFASHGDAFPSPKGTATPPNPHSHCCSSGSQQLSHGCTPKAALEFLPGARLPPKMPFLSGMCRTRGGCGPSCCPSPAQGPLLSGPSQRLPAAPMLPTSCPEAPHPPAGFSHGSHSTRQLCGM